VTTVILLQKLDVLTVNRFLERQAQSNFSYPEVGASFQKTVPVGYILDHHQLGSQSPA
jgi:hypothetical protein